MPSNSTKIKKLAKSKIKIQNRSCYPCSHTFFNKLAQLSTTEQVLNVNGLESTTYSTLNLSNVDKNIIAKNLSNSTFCHPQKILYKSEKYKKLDGGGFVLWNLNGQPKIWLQIITYLPTLVAEFENSNYSWKNVDSSEYFLHHNSAYTKYIATTELHGEQSDIFQIRQEEQKLIKKAAAKYFTDGYVQHLAALENSPLQKSYQATLECASELYQNGHKISAKYCKQRWCLVCNRIRTAKLINGYAPQIDAMSNAHFLTLTLPNVPAEHLRSCIWFMQQEFRKIYKAAYKYFKVAKKKKNEEPNPLKGLKKLECTYNPDRDDYHPHFHFILDNEEIGEYILSKWFAMAHEYNFELSKDGQDLQPIYGNGSKELFKYFTKIVSKMADYESKIIERENSIYIERERVKKQIIVVPALDVIFRCMYNKRVYEPFGIKAVSDKIKDLESEKYAHLVYETLTWQWNGENWYNVDTNQYLTDYQASESINKLLQKIVY